MADQATPGHGVQFGYEQDPDVPGVFTMVAELFDFTWPALSRETTETTPHGVTIDEKVFSPVIKRGPTTYTLNFIHDDPTHDHETGMIACMADPRKRGFIVVGPGGSSGDDEWIYSGGITNFQQKTPARSGQRTADVTMEASGRMKIDGVFFD